MGGRSRARRGGCPGGRVGWEMEGEPSSLTPLHSYTSHSTEWKSCRGQLERSHGSADHCTINSQKGLDSGDKLPSQCER